MDERSGSGTRMSATPRSAQQQVLLATARALAESETLEDAAPRMLKAICDALGWQCGAIWQVDRARNILRCVGTWHAPDLPLEEFTAVTTAHSLRHRRRTARAGLGHVASRPGFGTSRATPTFRGRRSPSAPGCIRPSRCRSSRAARRRRDGVLQPRHPRTDVGPAGDDDAPSAARSGCTSSGNGPARNSTGSSGCRWICSASPRSTAISCALNPAWQTVLGYSEEEMRASPFMDFVHPDDRDATIEAMSALHDRRTRHRFREPVPCEGRIVQVAAVDVGAVHPPGPRLRRGARRDGSPRGRRALQQNAERLAQLVQGTRRGARSAPNRRPSPRASSWPT